MDWARVHQSFFEELGKIAEVDLSGVSPQNALQMQPAPVMETTGLAKALAILDRVDAQQAVTKVASPRVPFNPDLPHINTLSGAKKSKKKRTAVDQGKSLGAHTAGGIGVGRLAGELSILPGRISKMSPGAVHGRRWYGAVTGGALGAAEFARKRLKERRDAAKEKAAFVSPAMQLKASRQVASLGGKTTGRFSASPRALTRSARGSMI